MSTAMPGTEAPEVQAIEAALPRLASELDLVLELLTVEIERDAASEGGEPVPAHAPLRPALARWLALRAAGAMVVAMPDAGVRARIANELEYQLVGPPPGPRLEEAEASRLVMEAIRDSLRQGALRDRLESAAEQAVRHVLLGGPAPEGSDRIPTPDETAGMGRRLVAYLLDYSLVMCLGFVLGLVLVLAGLPVETLDERLIGTLLTAVGALVNIQLLHATGTTLGKLSLGLEVVRASDGGRLELETAFRREILGRLLNNVFLGLGYLAGLRHPLHQTWGDRLAGTVVVRLRRERSWLLGARMATVASAVTATLYLPALLAFGKLDEQAGALIEREHDLVSLADSVYTLASRPVVTDEEMTEDMRGIADLAPSVRDRARKIRNHTSRLLQVSRVLAPWQAGGLARLDSMYVLVDRCMVSAEELAKQSLAADEASPADAPELRRRAQYAASDLEADHDYLRTLVLRIAGRSEDG